MDTFFTNVTQNRGKDYTTNKNVALHVNQTLSNGVKYWLSKHGLNKYHATLTFQRDTEACGPGGQGQKQNKLQDPHQPHHPPLVNADSRDQKNVWMQINWRHLEFVRHSGPTGVTITWT